MGDQIVLDPLLNRFEQFLPCHMREFVDRNKILHHEDIIDAAERKDGRGKWVACGLLGVGEAERPGKETLGQGKLHGVRVWRGFCLH
jgi:hypothetical protein